MTQIQTLPSLLEFVSPSEEVINAIEDLSIYYQFCNQAGVNLFVKWQGKEWFKGSLLESVQLNEMKELLEMAKGKRWDHLLRAIFLLRHYSTELDLAGFAELDEQQQAEVVQIIVRGQRAFAVVNSWLKPLDQQQVLVAIRDASKVKIGNGRYDKFEVLKIGQLGNNPDMPRRGFKLYEHVLQIDDPASLAEWLKQQQNLDVDMLILTFRQHVQRAWKSDVNFFLLWKGALYVLNMSERRLNVDNTEGDRNPDRYLERTWDKIWLPIEALTSIKDDSKKIETTAIELRTKKVIKRANLSDIFKEMPESQAWLEMFLLRALDYIENAPGELPRAVTPADYLRMLPDKSNLQKIDTRVKTADDYSSFHSINDSSSYLLKKYQGKITAIVPALSELPQVMGTAKYVEGVVRYQQRKHVADALEKVLWDDFKENSARVYGWWRDFVLSRNVQELVRQALADEEYTYMRYPDSLTGSPAVPTLKKGSILNLSKYLPDEDDLLEVALLNGAAARRRYYRADEIPCQNCLKFRHNVIIQLTFKDYRQVCDFFKIKEEDLPREFVEHFHWQNESYVGNSILDDTDPVDEITDPWFRAVYTPAFAENDSDLRASGQPHLDIHIPLCTHCFKSGKAGMEHYEKYPWTLPSLTTRKKILKYIECNPFEKPENIAYALGMRELFVDKHLQKLRVEGLIKTETDKDRKGRWGYVLTDKAKKDLEE